MEHDPANRGARRNNFVVVNLLSSLDERVNGSREVGQCSHHVPGAVMPEGVTLSTVVFSKGHLLGPLAAFSFSFSFFSAFLSLLFFDFAGLSLSSSSSVTIKSAKSTGFLAFLLAGCYQQGGQQVIFVDVASMPKMQTLGKQRSYQVLKQYERGNIRTSAGQLSNKLSVKKSQDFFGKLPRYHFLKQPQQRGIKLQWTRPRPKKVKSTNIVIPEHTMYATPNGSTTVPPTPHPTTTTITSSTTASVTSPTPVRR
jgi:hypothetical protein